MEVKDKIELAKRFPIDTFDEVMEEGAEVTQAICKYRRFGPDNSELEGGMPNWQHLFLELQDLKDAVEVLEQELLKEHDVSKSQGPKQILGT